MGLDPNSKVPKYIQIRKWLLGMINRGRIEIGSKIPTEEEIARRFGVNRMTVRQALDELVLEKMIIRKRGEGSILVSSKPRDYVYELDNITSFNDDMQAHGIEPIHEVLRVEAIQAEKAIIGKLELGEDRRVVQVLGVKRVGNEPVLIERSFLPFTEFSKLLEMNLTGPFYHLLVEEFGVTLHHATQIFSAVNPPQEEMSIFGMDPVGPCMLLESIAYDPDDIPIEYLRSYYRGDRYSFKATSGEYLFSQEILDT